MQLIICQSEYHSRVNSVEVFCCPADHCRKLPSASRASIASFWRASCHFRQSKLTVRRRRLCRLDTSRYTSTVLITRPNYPGPFGLLRLASLAFSEDAATAHHMVRPRAGKIHPLEDERSWVRTQHG